MAQNWWEQDQVVDAPAAVPGFIPGRPKMPDPIELAREARAQRGELRDEQRFQITQQRQNDADARQDRTEQRVQQMAGRLPEGKERTLTDAVSVASSLSRALRTFDPNYLGLGSDIENFAQGYSPVPVGTPGQRDWWADFRRTDNIERNELFGASLSGGEKAAYAATTITPNMSPDEARRNIQRRAEIVRGALRRYRDFLVSSGYTKEPIDTLIGTALDELPASNATPREKISVGEEINRQIDRAAGIDPADLTPPPGFLTPEEEEVFAKLTPQQKADYLAGSANFPGLGLVANIESEPIKKDREDAVVDPFMRGVADTVTFGFADELAAGANTIFSGGTMKDNLLRERAINTYDDKYNPVPRIAGQVAGGLVLPTFGASTPAQLARLGAGYGGAYGFGSGEGSVGDRLISAAGGAAVGSAVGYGAGRLLQPRQGPPNPVAEAFERQGVEGVTPDVLPQRRGAYSFLESLPVSGGRVRADLERGARQIELRVETVAGGPAVPRETAGRSVIEGAERYVQRSRGTIDRLYTRAESLSGNAPVTPVSALAAADRHIAELADTPSTNATKLRILNQVRADLVDADGNVRPLGIQSLRDLRTAMRDELSANGLRYSDTERRVMNVIDAASQDIRSGLTGAAARAYDRADRAYRERAQIVDTVIERFIGSSRSDRKSPEQVMSAIENAAKPRSGDAARLDQLMSRLGPGEQDEVRQAVAGTLGRRGEDAENAFTPNLFFSQIGQYSDEALRSIFGQRGAEDLLDLKRIAEARAGTLARLNNSGSGRVSNWLTAVNTLLSGGGLGAATGAVTGVGAGAGATAGFVAAPGIIGGAYLTAHIMGNPRAVAAIAQAARAGSPGARREAIGRLSRLATRDPAISAEIIPIRDFLSQAAAQSPTRAAAQGQNEDDRR